MPALTVLVKAQMVSSNSAPILIEILGLLVAVHRSEQSKGIFRKLLGHSGATVHGCNSSTEETEAGGLL